MDENIIEMRGISKQFNNIWVLKDVTFIVKRGEVHSLYGENGAGKSVLMKLLSGVLQPDSGKIYLSGERVSLNSPNDAQMLGIRTIHQEQNLFADLSVAENMFISNVPSITGYFKLIKRSRMYEECEHILKELNFNIDPGSMLGELSIGERQMVEIAKALVCKSNVIIMDEPTSSLTEVEICKLYNIIEKLKNKGISIIFISHRMEEVLKISDSITIIRDGEIVATDTVKNMSKELLIKLSAGEDYKDRYPKLPVQRGRVLFKAFDLSTERKISNISFDVRKGEIFGIAGLVGSGRTAIARAIFGLDKLKTGAMYLNGTKLNLKSPGDAIKAGIGYISEERLSEGLVENLNIRENITLSNLKTVLASMFISFEKEKNEARKFVKKLVIKTPTIEQKAKYLSGGNQQKLAIAKWLSGESKLLIFDEPTTGLDTGSKVEVYNIMNEIVRNNSAIIMISSDLSELIGMCDKILVIYNGKIAGELNREDFTSEKILLLASGESKIS